MSKSMTLMALAAAAQAVSVDTDASALQRQTYGEAIMNYTFQEHEAQSYGFCEYYFAAVPAGPEQKLQMVVLEASPWCTHGVRMGARLPTATVSNLRHVETPRYKELDCEHSDLTGFDECMLTLGPRERAGWITNDLKSRSMGVQVPLVEVLEPEDLREEVFTSEHQNAHSRDPSDITVCHFGGNAIDLPEGTYVVTQARNEWCWCEKGFFKKSVCSNNREFYVRYGLKFPQKPNFTIDYYYGDEPECKMYENDGYYCTLALEDPDDLHGFVMQIEGSPSYEETSWVDILSG